MGKISFLSILSSCHRFLFRVKESYVYFFALMANPSSPLSISRVPANSIDSRAIVLPWIYVLTVLFVACLSKVVPFVIQLVSVFMVDPRGRKSAGHIKPCQAMGKVSLAVNAYFKVKLSSMPRDSSWINSVPGSFDASEYPGVGIVMKKFAQSFCGKIGFSHDALQRLIGQRPPVDLRSLGALS